MLEDEQDCLCALLELLAFLQADDRAPRQLVAEFPLPDDNGGLDSVLEIDDLVFCR